MARTLRFLARQPVAKLRGCGPKLEQRLAQLEIHTVLDLLEHYPRRYLDRRKRAEIVELEVGEEATVYGEVTKVSGRRTRNRRSLVEVTISDGAAHLRVTFFNQPWREKQLQPGTEAAFFGKVDTYRGRRQMTNPAVDVFGPAGGGADKTGVLVPIYPQSGKAEVDTWQIQRLVTEALERAGEFEEPLPESLLDEHDLVDRTLAYRGIHQPEDEADWQAARKRLVFDEFLRMQLGLVARKRALEDDRLGIAHRASLPGEGSLVEAFHRSLPFELTGAQVAAIEEITSDMASSAPMHRLLQGDVGSGKTVVALSALLIAVQGGHQGALMAPTAVLAEQHFLTIASLLEGLSVPAEGTLMGERPVRVELLTNRTTAARRRQLEAELGQGLIDVLVGTHALLYGELEFHSLGLAVIDEQHRFGVEQRALLRGRGEEPDVLVMTATPIPRTAAMLVYGDLDKSDLREMPPGRIPITTEMVEAGDLGRSVAYARLRSEVEAGHQAFVVCPLVEGSDKLEAKAATEEYERLAAEELEGLALGLLHGQMPPKDKEAVMERFRARELDVLVATTVIEVGVDIPNATVMVVEDADRFGLAQLHQLRGRVGRGGGAAYCYLIASPSTQEGEDRMKAMVESTDGFLLAERDLEIRGAGEVFGERQAGFSDLKLGRLPRDEPVVMETRTVAESILDADSRLTDRRQLAEEVEDLLGDDVEFLFKS